MHFPSRTQVNKAGDVLRAVQLGKLSDPQAYVDAYDVMLRFRAAHEYPMLKANVGLRSMVVTAECNKGRVSQRLKRVPTILDKLAREPKMELGRMQDIGGCRVVLDSIDEVRRVQRRAETAMVRRTGRQPRVSDYIADPRHSGYRGVHVIVIYDDRSIEIQLRTQVMHQWAIAVERLSGRLREDLKSGRGPTELLEWLEGASEAMAIEEAGEVVDQGRLERLAELHSKALPWIEGGRR